MRPRLAGLRARLAGSALVLAAVGLAAALAAGALGAHAGHRGYRAPGALARLLDSGPAPGLRALLDSHGHRLLDRHGRPLFVDRHGRVVDAAGRLVRRHGHIVRITPSGRLPGGIAHRPARRAGHSAAGRRRGAHRTPGDRHPASRAKAPVVVGVAYTPPETANQTYAQYGGNLQAADEGAELRALADHLNATGGIAGHRIVLRVRREDFTNSTYDQRVQQACDYYAAPPRVSVILDGGFEPARCAARLGALQLDGGSASVTTSFLRSYGSRYFMPGGIPLDFAMTPYIRGLAAQGFFRDARVGLLFASGSDDDASVKAAVRRELSGVGARLADEEDMPDVTSAAQVPDLIARLGNAVVRFRLARVDHLIAVDSQGIYLGLFVEAAEAQGYRPRYGVSSLDEPNLLLASDGVPKRAFQGAVGVGWSPIMDVPPSSDPGSPLRSRCAALFARAGVATGGRTDAGQQTAYSACGFLFMLRRAAAISGGTSPAQLAAGIQALGSSFAFPTSLATRFAPDRHWGAAAARPLAFDGGCRCFRYSGGAFAVG